MAEGAGAQNQGQQPQSDQSKEVKPEAVDQKKLERAAKERERRRRRRRKKAELKRLQRETLQQQGTVPEQPSGQMVPKPEELAPPQPTKLLPAAPEKTPAAEKVRPAEKQQLPEKKRRPRIKKALAVQQPKVKVQPAIEPPERRILKRSEEHVPRSKDILQQPEPKKAIPEPESIKEIEPRQPQKPEAVEEEKPIVPPAEEEPHPLTHKTHSFTGPLIVQSSVPEQPPAEQTPVQPETLAEAAKEEQPLEQPAPQPEEEIPVQPEKTSPTEDIVFNEPHNEVRPTVSVGHAPESEHLPPDEEIPIFPEKPLTREEQKLYQEEQVEEVQPLKKIDRKPLEEEVRKMREKTETSKEKMPESEGLQHRRSWLQGAGAFSAGLFKSIGGALHNLRLKLDWRKVGVFLVLVALGGGLYAGYLFKVHEKIYDYVAGFFKTPPPVEVQLDDELLREWGITTAYVFGDNRGSTSDLLAAQLFDAYYFGYLEEPQVQGETGITAAYIYGLGQDLVNQSNAFIQYVNDLRELVSTYDVDVYKMLDRTTDREKALNDHLALLQSILDKSTKNDNAIKAEIDSTKVSYDSLNPDKTRFESDFFTALQGLAGEKADFLLKSFIDVDQKQVALKAHLSALQKLATYYDSSIQKLTVRITAIQKNHQALVQGIRVVDIPGANLDIIIKGTP